MLMNKDPPQIVTFVKVVDSDLIFAKKLFNIQGLVKKFQFNQKSRNLRDLNFQYIKQYSNCLNFQAAIA